MRLADRKSWNVIAVQMVKPPAPLFIVAKLLRGYTDLFFIATTI
jgi:hypothetical protein